jgi:hypothetical protein
VRRIAQYLPFCFLALGCAQYAAAQTSFDLNLGFGSFHDSAAPPAGFDSVTGNACGSVAADPNCLITPTNGMGGFFLGFGMDMLIKKNYGAGFSWDLTPGHSNYEPTVQIPASQGGGSFSYQYRQHFIDINGIYAPINNKKVVLKIMPGIGDAKTGISVNESACVTATACQSQRQPGVSTRHFDIHMGVGVQIFVTDHIFIRPQFDYHYVPNLTDEFGSNSVFGGMVWLGYSWGDR